MNGMAEAFRLNWKWLAKVIVTSGLIYWVTRVVDFSKAWSILVTCNWAMFSLAFAFITVSMWLQAVRWRRLSDTRELSIWKFFYFTLVGTFFSVFMPSAYGGDVVKVLYFGRKHGSTQKHAGVTLLIRATGLGMQWVLGFVGLVLYWSEIRDLHLWEAMHWNIGKMSLLMAGLIGIFTLTYLYRSKFLKQEWFTTIRYLMADKLELLVTLLYTFGIQILGNASIYVMFLSFDVRLPWSQVFCFPPLINTLMLLPLSLGGVGMREYLNLYFFTQLGGTSQDITISVSALSYVVLAIYVAWGGLWFAFRKFIVKEKPQVI